MIRGGQGRPDSSVADAYMALCYLMFFGAAVVLLCAVYAVLGAP